MYHTNSGKIESIYQKNSDGFTVEFQDKFELELKLKSPSIIYFIEVKSRNTEWMSFELYNNKDKEVALESVDCMFKTGKETILVEFPKSKS